MKRVILNGCGGKMGRMIAELAPQQDFEVVAGVDKFPCECAFPVFGDLAECDIPADVLIDISRPDALPDLLAYARRTHTPVVIATTGLSAQEQAMIADASREVAMFQAANLSLGVNLLMELSRRAAEFFGEECDIEIIEKHHNQKVDSPSGTALALADNINKAYVSPKSYTCGRHGGQTKRTRSEIGIHAVRGGNIVGEHEVMFITPHEHITVAHSAQNRAVFARGALAAAKMLCGRKNGLYTMQNLLVEGSAVSNLFTDEEQVLFCLTGISPTDSTVAELFDGLTREDVNVDMINQTEDGKGTLALGVSLPRKDSVRAMNVIVEVLSRHSGRYLRRDDVLKIVLEGEGMATQSGVASRFYRALAAAGVNPLIVTTSATNISCCVQKSRRREALESLMSEFGL